MTVVTGTTGQPTADSQPVTSLILMLPANGQPSMASHQWSDIDANNKITFAGQWPEAIDLVKRKREIERNNFFIKSFNLKHLI